jgi:hypothetical membrane protein
MPEKFMQGETGLIIFNIQQMKPKHKKSIILITSLAGIAGCLIDLGGTFILGNRIEGYHQLKGTMSQMGILSSPVATQIALCWIAMGILVILFGVGIRVAYEERKKMAGIASLLVILYGFGEGMISGIFPADKAGEAHTWTGIVHNSISGVGVLAIMIFPLVIRRMIPSLRRVSIVVFFIGTIGVILFGIGRLVSNPDHFLAVYKGSWQRLYVMDYYVYIIIIAVKMISGSMKTYRGQN